MLGRVYHCPPIPAYKEVTSRDFLSRPGQTLLKLGIGYGGALVFGSPSRQIDETLRHSQLLLITELGEATGLEQPVAVHAYRITSIEPMDPKTEARVNLFTQAIFADRKATLRFLGDYGRSLGEEAMICTGAVIKQRFGLGSIILESTWNEISEDSERFMDRLVKKYPGDFSVTPTSFIWRQSPEPKNPLIVPSS